MPQGLHAGNDRAHKLPGRAACMCSAPEAGRLQVDPSIIGGLILSVGDRLVDLSISTRVKRVQQILAEGVS